MREVLEHVIVGLTGLAVSVSWRAWFATLIPDEFKGDAGVRYAANAMFIVVWVLAGMWSAIAIGVAKRVGS